MAQGLQPAPHDDGGVSNLLPELLLGLLGHVGGAFVCENREAEERASGSIPKLSSAVDWITQPEREQLDRLVRLGHFFARLEAFVDSTTDHSAGDPLIYHVALASGLDELLDVYRSAVLQVEQRLLRPPTPPLLALRHFLSDFEVLLPDAAAVVEEVQRDGLRAAQIMRLLDRRTRCGIPAVQACASRLLWHCHQVMFKQLEAWTVYGMLIDSSREFFILHAEGMHGMAGLNISSSSSRNFAAAKSASDLTSLDGFYVAEDALPPAVSHAVAQAVLFIGKSVRILRHPLPSGKEAEQAQLADAEAEFAALSETLRELQQAETLRPAALCHAVESVQTKVAGMLWELLQQRCDLSGQLAAAQAYFLLGKGDLYQQLLQDTAAMLLAGPPSPATAEADVAQAFSQAAAQSTAEDDPFFSAYSLRWFDPAAAVDALPAWHPARDASLHVPSYDGWDGLCLQCRIDWPVQLLLPAEVLRRYCAVWQFMFRLRRTQIDLEAAWGALSMLVKPQKQGPGIIKPLPSSQRQRQQLPSVDRALLARLGLLRQRMTHFAANLALYLLVDVAGAAGATLRSAMAAAADFTQADAAHRTYVETLCSQACLDVRQLMAAVEAIFGLCRRFCGLVASLETGALEDSAAAAEARDLAEAFRLKHNVVFQLLQSNRLQSGARAAGLRQLVLRLNFNRFCELDA